MRLLKILIIFLCGIAIGAVGMAYIFKIASPAYVQNLEASYSIEQQRQATIAAQNGNWLVAAFSFRNSVISDSEHNKPFGIEALHLDIFSPFALLALENTTASPNGNAQSIKITASISYAKYALALEKSGHPAEAEVQWKKVLGYGIFKSTEAARNAAIKTIESDIKFFNEK